MWNRKEGHKSFGDISFQRPIQSGWKKVVHEYHVHSPSFILGEKHFATLWRHEVCFTDFECDFSSQRWADFSWILICRYNHWRFYGWNFIFKDWAKRESSEAGLFRESTERHRGNLNCATKESSNFTLTLKEDAPRWWLWHSQHPSDFCPKSKQFKYFVA